MINKETKTITVLVHIITNQKNINSGKTLSKRNEDCLCKVNISCPIYDHRHEVLTSTIIRVVMAMIVYGSWIYNYLYNHCLSPLTL